MHLSYRGGASRVDVRRLGVG